MNRDAPVGLLIQQGKSRKLPKMVSAVGIEPTTY